MLSSENDWHLNEIKAPLDDIEPSWLAIKQWIPADEDEISFHWQDTHHSNESCWKPREVLLDDGRILVTMPIDQMRFA